MRDEYDLGGADAGRVAAWTQRVLIEALRNNPNPLKRQKGR